MFARRQSRLRFEDCRLQDLQHQALRLPGDYLVHLYLLIVVHLERGRFDYSFDHSQDRVGLWTHQYRVMDVECRLPRCVPFFLAKYRGIERLLRAFE